MRKLFMTYAEVRRTWGQQSHHRPSRFLHEIPAELINEIRFRTKTTKMVKVGNTDTGSSSQATGAFRVGQEVHHRIFGNGTVLHTEGEGEDMKVKVRFAKVGTKLLISSYLTAK